MHARLIIETVSWHLLDIIKCPDTPALALKFLNIENVFLLILSIFYSTSRLHCLTSPNSQSNLLETYIFISKGQKKLIHQMSGCHSTMFLLIINFLALSCFFNSSKLQLLSKVTTQNFLSW